VAQIGQSPAAARPVELPAAAETPATGPSAKPGVIASLATEGRAVLSDLTFASGSAELDDAAFPSLKELASKLAANPGWKIALVGHTDTLGSAEANMALSQRRAEAVKDRMVNAFGVETTRIEAAGVGFLAPIATNLSPEGRAMNRRVEVVLITTE
jgi:OOP family OmpA-OmpF porin